VTVTAVPVAAPAGRRAWTTLYAVTRLTIDLRRTASTLCR
jgi:hypothetical protein